MTGTPISDRSFWARSAAERAATWTELREREPVSFQPSPSLGARPSGAGFWAVTRLEDVQLVSRTPEVFCSGQGVGLSEVPQDLLELNASFLVMDAPRHTDLRKVVSSAFTLRQVARLENDIAEQANRFVDAFVQSGGGDVVQDLAMKLPLWTISHMLGIPESLQQELYTAAEMEIASQDPEYASTPQEAGALAVKAAQTLHRLAGEMVAARRREPTDDIWGTVVRSTFEGEPLSDALLGGIFVLFATAANDTTRNTTSHAIKAFADNPAQWALLKNDPTLINTAVEEMVRWASPVIHFRRTALQDTELAGIPIYKGDAVVVFYESANRDATVFDNPFAFDITRDPNPHVGFGGGGPHFCLGANLARAQLRAVFSRLAERVDAIGIGQPDFLASNFINGIKRMPVTVTPR